MCQNDSFRAVDTNRNGEKVLKKMYARTKSSLFDLWPKRRNNNSETSLRHAHTYAHTERIDSSADAIMNSMMSHTGECSALSFPRSRFHTTEKYACERSHSYVQMYDGTRRVHCLRKMNAKNKIKRKKNDRSKTKEDKKINNREMNARGLM